MGQKDCRFDPLPRDTCLENLVPRGSFYGRLEERLDLSFVRELVRPLYAGGGRPSVDPVVFFKLQLVMFFEDLRSERQVMRAVADRPFLCVGIWGTTSCLRRAALRHDVPAPTMERSNRSEIPTEAREEDAGMLLRAVPDGWFSYDFAVLDASGSPVGRADLSDWRERANLDVGGEHYEARHGTWEREFVLAREDGRTVVVAEKPSVWRDRFSFGHGGRRYELRKESVWSSDLTLSRGDEGMVGSVRHKGVFRREWEADLPDELPPEVGIFVVWLAVLLARRSDSAAASSATGGT